MEEKHGRRRKQEKIPVLWWFLKNNCVFPSSGQWSFIGLGSKKWYSIKEDSLKESGTISRRRCWLNSPKAEIQCSVLRFYCPEVILKSTRHGKLSFANQETIETIFRIISANQINLYGGVAEICTNPFTKERSDLLWWDNQSCSVRSRQKFLWRVMTQHIRIFYFNNMMQNWEVVTTR